jgi:hypothetical protein
MVGGFEGYRHERFRRKADERLPFLKLRERREGAERREER